MSAGSHSERAHAPWAPSSAKRWLHCFAAVPRTEQMGELPESYTLPNVKGTAMHEESEKFLENGQFPQTYKNQILARSPDGSIDVLINAEEWHKHVVPYVEAVRSVKEEIEIFDDAEMWIEDRVTVMKDKCWGSLDATVFGNRELHLFDLKTGSMLVEAEDNEQMMTYAVGTLEKLGWDAFDRIFLYISQAEHPDGPLLQWEVDQKTLLEHRARIYNAIHKSGQMAAGNIPIKGTPGSWCHWCPVGDALKCPEKNDMALAVLDDTTDELVVPSKADLEAMPLEKMEFLALNATKIKKVLDLVAERVKELALSGGTKMTKVVEGRSSRKWVGDEHAIATIIEEEGLEPFDAKLRSFSHIEKEMGKKRFAEVLGDFVEKPPGKPTLVSVDDPKPALSSTDVLDDGETA